MGVTFLWPSWLSESSHPRYWIEEPTSPDDILGHAAIQAALDPLSINVATGEQISNKVMHKQYLQSTGYC